MFLAIEKFSDEYLTSAQAANAWPIEYPWPLDALHCNTRLWEYPFAVRSVRDYVLPRGRILDIGSALTFFPMFLAAEGFQVVASDYDPRMVPWFRRIAERAPIRLWPRDRLCYERLDVTVLDVAENSFDAVTNISVLEHLPMIALERAAASIHRVLKPGGIFVCTLDCWIGGARTPEHHPLDQAEFANFFRVLRNYFEEAEAREVRTPCDFITNVQFPRDLARAGDATVCPESLARRIRRAIRTVVRGDYPSRLNWCVYGIVLRKRG